MVSVLAIRSNVHRFKPIQGDGFLRAIKICSMPSLEGEVKPRAHVIRFYDMYKIN
jgi:hypothetical protein